jgi:hypothetical protein
MNLRFQSFGGHNIRASAFDTSRLHTVPCGASSAPLGKKTSPPGKEEATAGKLVEQMGIKPTTSSLRTKRSIN